jgi:hypothetical protein
VKTFEVRIIIEHIGGSSTSIPGQLQPDFVAALERHDPKPARIEWSDMHHSNETVVVYAIEAQSQFDATAAAKDIFERVFRPRLAQFNARLDGLVAVESNAHQPS